MGTQTPTLLLAKPTVNGPETANTWGVDINLNFDKIDAWTGPLPARIAALETGAASGVPEAPNDGQTYGRKSLGWSALDLTVDWAEILGKPTTFPPAAHTHVISDVTGLQGALDAKAPLASPALTGTPSAPTAAPATNTTQLATTAFVGAAVAAGGGILEAPNDGQTYGRKSLGWTILDVTPAWSELSGVPATFPPSVHTHVIADVTGLQTALNAKAPLADPVFTGNPTAPTPAQADNDTSIATTAFVTTALSTAVGGKISEAPNDGQTYGRKSLGWSILDITPDWTELLNKPATFPPSTHTHVIADVTGLQPALDAKAPLAGPVFTGDPQAPTPATADNDTSIATTAFVKAQGYATATYADTQDALRVLKAGDTMTGDLTIGKAQPGITLNQSGAGAAGALTFSRSGVKNWSWGVDTGGGFQLARYNTTTGALLDTPLYFAPGGQATFGYAIAGPSFSTPADDAAGVKVSHSSGGSATYPFLYEIGGTARFGLDGVGRMLLNPLLPSGTPGSINASFCLTANKDMGYGGILVQSMSASATGPHYSANHGGASVFFVNTNGSLSSTSGSITVISDAAYKEDVAPIPYGLAEILKLNPIMYRLKSEDPETPPHYGFTAQEVQPIFPELVHTSEQFAKEGEAPPLVLMEGSILIPLVKAVQELAARVAELEAAL